MKVGDKFKFPSGELAHVIEVEPTFVARVNGSGYCIEGTKLSFAGMVEQTGAEKITDEAYRDGIDTFWRKRRSDVDRVERWT